jgi:hypothetical protein
VNPQFKGLSCSGLQARIGGQTGENEVRLLSLAKLEIEVGVLKGATRLFVSQAGVSTVGDPSQMAQG